MVANRYKGIRCILAHNTQIVELARKHNNANVLALGGKYTSKQMALKIIKTFLETRFEKGRHLRRIDKF